MASKRSVFKDKECNMLVDCSSINVFWCARRKEKSKNSSRAQKQAWSQHHDSASWKINMKTTRRSTGRNTGNPNSMSGRAWLPGFTYDLRSELTKTFFQIAPEAKNQNKTKQKKYWEKIIKHTHSQDKSMLVLSILYFLCERWAVWDINVTLGLLPSQAQVIWRDSVSVQAQCQGSKTEFAGILQQDQQSLSVPCTVLTSTKKGRNSCLRLLPRFRCRLDVLQI